MPVECPNCREPISRFRLFRTTAFGRWRCKHCDALIAVDTRRRLLGIVAGFVLALCLIVVVEMGILPPRAMVTFPFLIGATVLTVLAIDRPMLIERAGFRCRACGYDLRGQVVPRCPECGTELDKQQQTYFAFDNRPAYMPVPGAQRGRRRYIAAILLFVAMMMATGVMVGVYARRQRAIAAKQAAAASAAAAKQTATQPAIQPTTMPATQSTTQSTMKPATRSTTIDAATRSATSAPAGAPVP